MTSVEKDISPEGNSNHFKHDIVTVPFSTIRLGNQNVLFAYLQPTFPFQ